MHELFKYFYAFMSSYTLKLIHTLNTDLDRVCGALLDMKTFGKLHPYMTSVELVDDKRPAYIEYAVREEVYFFGFLRNRPSYHAKVYDIEHQKHIRYTSRVKPFIFLTIDFVITTHDNSNITVNEQMELRCNKLLALVFFRILKASHLQVFEHLRKQSSKG